MARKPVVVNETIFRSAVANAEKDGGLKNLGVLYGAIVKQYTLLTIDDNELPPISTAIVKERLSLWQIEVKTDPGRKPKNNLFAARLAEITAAVGLIKSLVPVEMTDLLGLFDELVCIVNEPLEAPAESTETTTETAETTEETVEPATETVEVAETETERKLRESNEFLKAA